MSQGADRFLCYNLAHPPKAALAYFSPDHIRLFNSSKLASLAESQQHKNKSEEKQRSGNDIFSDAECSIQARESILAESKICDCADQGCPNAVLQEASLQHSQRYLPQISPSPLQLVQYRIASFVIAGGAESREGGASYAERTVRYRDLSPEGIKEKVRFTTGEMENRLGAFGFGWKDTTTVQAYTVHDFHPVIVEELVRRGATRSGLTWHFARPPVIDLEYEMDCRRVLRETVI